MPPNSKTNPNRGIIFLGGNCVVAPNPKTNPTIDPNPNSKQGGGGNCQETSLKKTVFCLLITDYDYHITKKLKIMEKITSQILCLSIQ